MTRRIATFLLLLMAIFGVAAAQDSAPVLKNSDVLEMMRSGLGRRTIVLLIQQGQCSFDTSPAALMKLKRAGVSVDVLRAMVAATPVAVRHAAPPPVKGEALLRKALDAFGPPEQLASVHSIRWKGTVVETTSDEDRTSFEEERIEVYPGRISLSVSRAGGPVSRLVITPEFSYESSEQITRAVGAASAKPYRDSIRFDPAYIAQHSGEFVVGRLQAEQDGGAEAAQFKISLGDQDYVWEVESRTGQLLSVKYRLLSGASVTREYSDYRSVGGMQLPFKWRTTEPGRTLETTVHAYEVNPSIDESAFERPSGLSGDTVTLKVLDSKTVAHGQELDSDFGASCQLSQERNTSAPNPLDDVHFTAATTPSNLQMSCNAWDNTKFWPRKLDAMLVMASDGNAYILTCDHGPRWSKCAPLRQGGMFHGRRTEKGLSVFGVNWKGKEQEIEYSIAQSEVLP
ncbi:MAG TPA: hypothetical protein VFW25_03395 [Silvibacterium sp.]|nr:hypothetical protein [Silvibacterium sp.]